LRRVEQAKDHLAARGVRIIAISVDAPDLTEDLRRTQKYTYTFLSDVKTEVIRLYYVLHAGGGVNGPDNARPSQFLVSSKGIFRWVNHTESYKVLDIPDMVDKALDSLAVPHPAAPATPYPRAVNRGVISAGTGICLAVRGANFVF
jgi:peroxiredoxin